MISVSPITRRGFPLKKSSTPDVTAPVVARMPPSAPQWAALSLDQLQARVGYQGTGGLTVDDPRVAPR
jgi:hypothetical protein